MAQFAAFERAVDHLYVAKEVARQASVGSEKDRLDSLVKKMTNFLVKLGEDQENIEKSFFQFKCSDAAARTGRGVYNAYKALSDDLKKQFEERSSVDLKTLDQIIKPVSVGVVIGTIKPERVTSSVSDHHSTLHSNHSKRYREKPKETTSANTSVEEVTSSATPSLKRGSGNY